MNHPITPDSDPRPKWGKWALLVVLVALAAFMYVGIIFKTIKFGY